MPQRINFNDNPGGAIDAAVDTVKRGGVVIFPTETFYGLGADPSNDIALRRLAAIKDRAASKPIPIIAANRSHCERLGDIPPVLMPLCDMFWPGPLTIALLPHATWPQVLLGNGKTIGVRVSSHPVAQALASAVGGLITSTSANPSNKPPIDDLAHLDALFASQVDCIIDAGPLSGGLPSTVVFARNDDVLILRAGAISEADITQILGRAPVML